MLRGIQLPEHDGIESEMAAAATLLNRAMRTPVVVKGHHYQLALDSHHRLIRQDESFKPPLIR